MMVCILPASFLYDNRISLLVSDIKQTDGLTLLKNNIGTLSTYKCAIQDENIIQKYLIFKLNSFIFLMNIFLLFSRERMTLAMGSVPREHTNNSKVMGLNPKQSKN